MELLLFWKDHYMDSWDAAKVASLSAQEKIDYDRRFQWGDVVEVREDGYWSAGHLDTESFCVVKVPGLEYDADKMDALWDFSDFANPVMTKRRKWFANKSKIPQNILNKVASQGNVVSVTETQFNAFVERHT